MALQIKTKIKALEQAERAREGLKKVIPYRTMRYHTVLYDCMILKDYTHILAYEAYG